MSERAQPGSNAAAPSAAAAYSVHRAGSAVADRHGQQSTRHSSGSGGGSEAVHGHRSAATADSLCDPVGSARRGIDGQPSEQQFGASATAAAGRSGGADSAPRTPGPALPNRTPLRLECFAACCFASWPL